jgi:hypothetical protein
VIYSSDMSVDYKRTTQPYIYIYIYIYILHSHCYENFISYKDNGARQVEDI